MEFCGSGDKVDVTNSVCDLPQFSDGCRQLTKVGGSHTPPTLVSSWGAARQPARGLAAPV